MQHAHTVTVEHRATIGWGCKTGPTGGGSEYTCFHGLNVVSCEIVWKVSGVEAGLGVSKLVCGVDGGVGSEVGSDNE